MLFLTANQSHTGGFKAMFFKGDLERQRERALYKHVERINHLWLELERNVRKGKG